jgi:hypothetical protein
VITWSAYVEYDARNVPPEVHERALELLPADGDTSSTAPNGNLSFYVSVEAPTAELAAAEALRVTGDTVRQAYGLCAVYGYEVVPLTERERRNREPVPVPELAGRAEVAKILTAETGRTVSPTRAGQIMRTKRFQEHAPIVAELASGPVVLAPQVRRFAEVWDTLPGPKPDHHQEP